MGIIIAIVLIALALIVVGVLGVAYINGRDDAYYRSHGYDNSYGGFMADVYDSGYNGVKARERRKAENLRKNTEKQAQRG